LIEEHTKSITLAKTREEYVFKIIDPALPPDADKPVKPKRMLMVVLGILGGLLLGIMTVLLREAIRARQRRPAEAS
jgi:uncharacterized protein involved in exopolysaccharide biosynthesis